MKTTSPSVTYTISIEKTHAHLFEVRCEIANPKLRSQKVSLPAWIPGSYLVRDFAKNIVQISAFEGSKKLEISKIDKDSWHITGAQKNLTVCYEVYAHDKSVRAAFLDDTRAFFNGTSLFLKVEGKEQQNHRVLVTPSKQAIEQEWRIATSMKQLNPRHRGWGQYESNNYEDLIEHPFEIGAFVQKTFEVKGVRHELVIAGCPDVDITRISTDLQRVTAEHIRFWGAMPANRFLFLVNAVNDGYGGLEHTHSTALICSRDDLPRKNRKTNETKYQQFLGLCSHEYFHLWNVKRLKPAAFIPYKLNTETHTELLWAFEGITSYYDDLILLRAGLIDFQTYLGLLAKTISSVQRTPGRKKQSVAESSFDAWTKFYKQDENAPNAIVSYYTKGSLVALCLDLYLRKHTENKCSLDLLMRELWKKYGSKNSGLLDQSIQKTAEEISGLRLNNFFKKYVRGVDELPLSDLLEFAGIKLNFGYRRDNGDMGGFIQPEDFARGNTPSFNDIGIRLHSNSGRAKISNVLEKSSGQLAGLSPGDEIVAVDFKQVSSRDLQTTIDQHEVGNLLMLHVFRDQQLIELKLKLTKPVKDTAFLTIV